MPSSDGGPPRRRRVVGNGVQHDTVAVRSLQGTRNFVSPGITNHEGSKGFLQRVGRAVLPFESGKRDSVDGNFLSRVRSKTPTASN